MKRPAAISLTVVTGLGIAARAQTYAPDPCGAPSFNGGVCQRAIRQQGFCSQGSWVPMHYQADYPHFYNMYELYTAAGGLVMPVNDESCKRPHGSAVRGGFGGTARGHAGGHAGS
jgi:hypothetical protein